MSSPTLFFFIKIILAFLCSLYFYMNFRLTLSISAKKSQLEIVIEIVLILYVNLWQYCYLKISSSNLWICDMFQFILVFHFFQLCFIIFILKILYFLCNLHLSTVLFFKKVYCVIFDTTGIGIAFLISFTDFPSIDIQFFVYWSCILQPCWTCLLVLKVFQRIPYFLHRSCFLQIEYDYVLNRLQEETLKRSFRWFKNTNYSTMSGS